MCCSLKKQKDGTVISVLEHILAEGPRFNYYHQQVQLRKVST